MFRFIHAADLHLDSPLRGLEKYEGAPAQRIRNAPRDALVQLVDLALRESVDFVVIAGDVYDGNWPDHTTGQFFSKQMARLSQANVPVILISGNHDAASKMTRSIRLPENVKRLNHARPETLRLEQFGVAIHGQSFGTPAVTEDLSRNYPAPIPGCFNIGLLHTSCTGAEGHENYAPCTLEGLRSLGYDYWALGHIHQRSVLCESPVIAFSGNIQGRHARELGPKGCFVVNVDSQHRATLQFEALDVLRWEHIVIDAPCAESLDQLLDHTAAHLRRAVKEAEDRLLVARITFSGETPLHDQIQLQRQSLLQNIRAEANHVAMDACWIEKIKFETQPLPSAQPDPATAEDAIAEILGVLDDMQRAPQDLARFDLDFDDVLRKLTLEELRTEEIQRTLNVHPGIIEQSRLRLLHLLRAHEVPS